MALKASTKRTFRNVAGGIAIGVGGALLGRRLSKLRRAVPVSFQQKFLKRRSAGIRKKLGPKLFSAKLQRFKTRKPGLFGNRTGRTIRRQLKFTRL